MIFSYFHFETLIRFEKFKNLKVFLFKGFSADYRLIHNYAGTNKMYVILQSNCI